MLFDWRWYDNAPLLPLWAALAFLLIAPRKNRNWRAWLILVVPALAAALQLLFLIPSLGASFGFDLLVQLLITFALAWAFVWLLAPYLATGNRLRNFFSALAVMMAAGLAAYLGYFGFWCSAQEPAMVICLWSVGSISLLAGWMLSGACCRSGPRPGKTALWLVLWLPVITAICLIAVYSVVVMGIVGRASIGLLFGIVLQLLIMSLLLSAILYAASLPVLVLARLTDCYRGRLRALVCGGDGRLTHAREAADGFQAQFSGRDGISLDSLTPNRPARHE